MTEISDDDTATLPTEIDSSDKDNESSASSTCSDEIRDLTHSNQPNRPTLLTPALLSSLHTNSKPTVGHTIHPLEQLLSATFG